MSLDALTVSPVPLLSQITSPLTAVTVLLLALMPTVSPDPIVTVLPEPARSKRELASSVTDPPDRLTKLSVPFMLLPPMVMASPLAPLTVSPLPMMVIVALAATLIVSPDAVRLSPLAADLLSARCFFIVRFRRIGGRFGNSNLKTSFMGKMSVEGAHLRPGDMIFVPEKAITKSENVSGSICLVEANFRTPSLPGLFGGTNHYGLADALRQEGAIRDFAKRTGRDNLWLLSSGRHGDDYLNLLSCDRMKGRMLELRAEFSFVLIDAPPLNAYGDALLLGRLVDGVVLVLEANATRREVALRIAENLRAAKIQVLAAVLNKRTFPIPLALYKRL